MKIKINGRSFIYPDSDIEWFDSLGNVKYKLMDRIVRSRPKSGDKFEPESWDNFNKTELKDKTVWVSKSRNSHHNNFEIEKKVEVKKDMVRIKSGGKWHEYPDDQIKSWDSEGNIEWSDNIHCGYNFNNILYKIKNNEIKPIIILGNDKSISNIDFSIFNNLTTAGVNRIYLKYKPDYLFFLDNDIIEEIKVNNIELKDTICITSKYNNNDKQRFEINSELIELKFKDHLHDKEYNHTLFSSVPSLIKQLNDFVFKEEKLCFFIFGVSLFYENVHFWNGYEYELRKSNDFDYDKNLERMDKMLFAFKKLMSRKYILFNCNPESRLNQIIPFVDIEKIKNINEI